MASLWPKSIHSLNIISPITFNSAIRQTLTLPNIPAIRYCHQPLYHFPDPKACITCKKLYTCNYKQQGVGERVFPL